MSTSSGPTDLSNLLPKDQLHLPNEPHDPHVHEPYTTSLQQRQQQAAEFIHAQHTYSQTSSSSGSVADSLRRTPNLDNHPPRPRSSSIDSAPELRLQPTVRFTEDTQSPIERSTRRRRASFQSRASELFAPHPALRISKRTAAAVHFALWEAILTPYPFTPDLVEENAAMSDLTGVAGGNGRAANGGARTTGGPVPVPTTGIRTPQMIMNQRRERDARRQAEADAARAAEEQRKAEEERRKSAERRAAAAGVTGQTSQRQPAQSSAQRSGDGPSAAYNTLAGTPQATAGTTYPGVSQSQDVGAGASHSRTRAGSQPQPRPAPQYSSAAPTATGEQRRPQPSQLHGRQPSGSAGPSSQARAGGPSAAQQPPQSVSQPPQPRSTISSFPHAFERWETLSSHWEGLTSYWIRRLEQNTEEVRREPLAQQMSRQITDLSAAGANLFHAVVELQRLRASSERKFQRWFYEHRQEQEQAQEREAQLEHTLRMERDARADAVANMERMATEKKNAERMVAEMKRELQISKEEARRAWEELGRREQEERDRTFSLREGQPTLVGGVQVVPMIPGMPSRHGSVSHRSHTAQDSFGSAMPGPSGTQGIEQHYSYEQGQSPTDTDPFTEGSRQPAAPLRHEPDVSSLSQGTYVPTGARSQASDQTQVPAPLQPHQRATGAQQPTVPVQTSRPEAFYQQPEAYLHRETASSVPDDERSYVTSQGDETSEGEEEFAIDKNGNFILDEAGRRVPWRSVRPQESDEFDVSEDRRRELEHLQRYGTGATGPSTYATSSTGAEYPPGYPTANRPDYSGDGYGDEWPGMRHHHPTRLSDVPEEDERSRTSPSRASQASRGLY